MLKSELLKALRNEISRDDLDTFILGGVTVPGCPACRKQFNTVSDYNDHITQDVLPRLINGLSSDSGTPPDEDYLDVDYWADPDRNIRRKSGEQDSIFVATSACSKAEWLMLLAGLGMTEGEG
jgi:hypothetical protein